ncbi:hypothetical protein DFAR_2210016 [Desulfarculales bacterium]
MGLGVDGAASNNDLSMIGELGATSRAVKLNNMDLMALSVVQTLDRTTTDSPGSGGRVVGRLASGMAPDVVVLRASAPDFTPMFDPALALVNQCRGVDLHHVLVAGRQVLSFNLKGVTARVRDLSRQVA